MIIGETGFPIYIFYYKVIFLYGTTAIVTERYLNYDLDMDYPLYFQLTFENFLKIIIILIMSTKIVTYY